MAEDGSYKSNLVALLLCFFFGAFGVHRFYVGKMATGTVQLLLLPLSILCVFWAINGSQLEPLVLAGASLIVVALWNLIDIILIVAQKFTDGDGKVLKFN